MSTALPQASEDRRQARTKAALWNGLIVLVREIGWQEATIKRLCQHAEVARSSFYLHFSNKQDLLDYGFRKTLEEAHQQTSDLGPSSRLVVLDWLVDHISESPDFFQNFGAAAENAFIYDRFGAAVADGLKQECERRGMNIAAERLAFISGGAMSLLRQWLASGLARERYQVKSDIQGLAQRCLTA